MEHARRPARADARGLHLARLPGRADQHASSWGCWSPASPTATPGCSPRSSPRSTCSAAAGRCSGIGAAWYDREHAGLGVPVPAHLRAVRAARGDAADLPPDVERRRRPLRRAGTTSSPRPSASRRRSAPAARRILIGGSGERKTLRLVAKYADACNLFGFEPARWPTRSRCSTGTARPRVATRPRSSAPSSRAPTRSTTSTRSCAGCEEYAALGIEQVWVGPNADDPVGSVTRICEDVLPRLREIGA